MDVLATSKERRHIHKFRQYWDGTYISICVKMAFILLFYFMIVLISFEGDSPPVASWMILY